MKPIVGLLLLFVGVSAASLAQGLTPGKAAHTALMPQEKTTVHESPSPRRRPIALSASERRALLQNMHRMLASVQGVIAALADDDMHAVATAAGESGMAMMREVPANVRRNFPSGFARLGKASHQAFDKIVFEAHHQKRAKRIMTLLSKSLQACDACHATYRFTIKK